MTFFFVAGVQAQELFHGRLLISAEAWIIAAAIVAVFHYGYPKHLVRALVPATERMRLTESLRLKAQAWPRWLFRGLQIVGTICAGVSIVLMPSPIALVLTVTCALAVALFQTMLEMRNDPRASDRYLTRAKFSALAVFILVILAQIILWGTGVLKLQRDQRVTLAPAKDVATNSGAPSTSATPGQSLTLHAGQSVKVQSGVKIKTVGGGLININGHNNTVVTPPGAVISVPDNATGPADNIVIAG
jgi:hypothetical protein